LRNLKISADLPGEFVVDFVVARNTGSLLGGATYINRVVAALA
jgi:hypothetical protein